ncbi:MAG: hypothetical protein AAFX52_14565 [Pseudomonadota bacterium]
MQRDRLGTRRCVRMAASLWLCLLAVSLGRSQALSDIGRLTQQINGGIEFIDCTPERQAKLQAAMAYLLPMLENGGALETCLANRSLTWDRGASPEHIVSRLREPLPTRIQCFDRPVDPDQEGAITCGGTACAQIGIPYEAMVFRNRRIDDGSTEYLASVIAHEVNHNKGWIHPFSSSTTQPNERRLSVPFQIGSCVWGGDESRFKRDEMSDEAILAKTGMGFGEPFEVSCNPGSHVQGMNVKVTRRGIRQVGIACDAGVTNSRAGLDSGRISSGACGDGRRAIGLYGTHREDEPSELAGLGLLCSHGGVQQQQMAEADQSGPLRVWVGGTSSGQGFYRQCPSGMALSRVYGRSGDAIHQLEPVCEEVGGDYRGRLGRADRIGVTAEVTERDYCNGTGGMVGLFGATNTETGVIKWLGGMCQATILSEDEPPHPIHQNTIRGVHLINGPATTHDWLPRDPRLGATDPFEELCPSGELMVGIDAREFGGIFEVSGMCADVIRWIDQSQTAEINTIGPRGEPTGNRSSSTCRRGYFLAGLQTWRSNDLDAPRPLRGIQGFCRRLQKVG